MKVYIARWIDYEEDEILGAFDTKKKAEDAIYGFSEKYPKIKPDKLFVHELEVQ